MEIIAKPNVDQTLLPLSLPQLRVRLRIWMWTAGSRRPLHLHRRTPPLLGQSRPWLQSSTGWPRATPQGVLATVSSCLVYRLFVLFSCSWPHGMAQGNASRCVGYRVFVPCLPFVRSFFVLLAAWDGPGQRFKVYWPPCLVRCLRAHALIGLRHIFPFSRTYRAKAGIVALVGSGAGGAGAVAIAGGGKGADSKALMPRAAPVVPKPEWHAPWKLYRVISGHTGWVRALAFDPTNQWFCTGSNDRTIKVCVVLCLVLVV